MKPFRQASCRLRCLAVLPIMLIPTAHLTAGEPVALRVGSFVVAPAHSPPAVVSIKNLEQTPYQGMVKIKLPDEWRFKPSEQEVSLAPGQTKRVAFTVTRGMIRQDNSYPVEVSATGSGTTVVRKQNVVCASAPYFKPTIDGHTDEWKDAIPVTFLSGGKKTVISTYWNRRQFSLLVAVEEDKLVAYGGQGASDGFDAVQLAISPHRSETGASGSGRAARYEFLFVATGTGSDGKCFLLATPDTKLAECDKCRELAALGFDKAKIAVGRDEGITYYECGIPFELMRGQIRPSEGREFCLSVLVHDPDGTGLRDWGQAAGLWPAQRNRLAWSRFAGAKWGDRPPFDNKLQWGLCSSKY